MRREPRLREGEGEQSVDGRLDRSVVEVVRPDEHRAEEELDQEVKRVVPGDAGDDKLPRGLDARRRLVLVELGGGVALPRRGRRDGGERERVWGAGIGGGERWRAEVEGTVGAQGEQDAPRRSR